MKLGYAIYYVPDVAATLAFYETAFGCSRGMLSEGGEFGTLASGETTLAFAQEAFLAADGLAFAPMRPEHALPPFEIAFVTADVAGAYAKALAGGAKALRPPREKLWGQTVAYVRDLNGFHIELCSPMGA